MLQQYTAGYMVCHTYPLSINSALETFKSEAEQLPKQFHSKFHRKLIGGKALRFILDNGSNIIAAPAGHQSSNGLAQFT